MQENRNSEFFDFLSIVRFFRRYFKWLVGLTLLGFVISIVLSLLIENQYKAELTLFAAPAISPSITLKAASHRKFGHENELDQLLQVLKTNEIKWKIIDKYNLTEHYDIDPDAPFARTSVLQTYNGNIKYSKTDMLSIKITVWDKDPEMAANMANDIAALLDSSMNKLQKQMAKANLFLVKKELFNTKRAIDIIQDSLAILGTKGISNVEAQSQAYSEALMEHLAKGNTEGVKRIEEKLQTLSKYGPVYESLKFNLENEHDRLEDLQTRYAEAKVDAEVDVAYKVIVNAAEKPERKSYPVRWLIVLIGTLLAAILATGLLAAFEAYKKIKKDLKEVPEKA